MSAKEDDFLTSLRATFTVEAEEHLQTITAGLLELEQASTPDEIRRLVEAVFRAAHSLKGAARAVNFTEIESNCQALEDVFAVWKRQTQRPSQQALDKVHRLLDAASRLVTSSEAHLVASKPSSAPPPAQPAGKAKPPESPISEPAHPATPPEASADPAASDPAPAPASAPSAVEKVPIAETVRINVAKLNTQLLEAQEMLTAKLAARQRASDLNALAEQVEQWQKEWAKVQPDVRALRQSLDRPASAPSPALPPGLTRVAEFIEWNHDYLRALQDKVARIRRAAEQDRLVIGKLVDDLLEDSKKLLMLPLGTLGALLPKIVRDLCRDQGKEASLTIRGEEVEIDKRILDELKDPLVHILRNCVDHGIETPEQRQQLGKPARATIALSVNPINGNKVEILVSDDGGGIDLDKVRESAVKHGFISRAEADRLSESETLALIFHADVTTSPIITRLSGRGLGLAIVREKTEKLGGHVSVESRRHGGTTLRIALPIALATFRGILIQVADRRFVVPTATVDRVTRFKPADVQTVEGRETLSLNGRAVALVRLADVLELPPVKREEDASAATPVLILSAGDQRIAFAVDAVLDEQEVLVKRLGKPLSRVRNIAGATILGDGRVSPILNVADLLKSARKFGSAPGRPAKNLAPASTEAKKILVVEDSITSRLLLKGILESAGYKVKTAVDGMDGFTALRTETFDLVVSDVEMPRLNGFDLTARIRADQKLAELPVVLVTALETPEDRERGIDAGANAYLVKQSFDQSNLLETIRRLA